MSKLVWTVLALGCSDADVASSDPEPFEGPVVRVEPSALELSTTGSLSVHNDGDMTLTVNNLAIVGSDGFDILNRDRRVEVHPGDALLVEIEWLGGSSAIAELLIESNVDDVRVPVQAL